MYRRAAVGRAAAAAWGGRRDINALFVRQSTGGEPANGDPTGAAGVAAAGGVVSIELV